MDCPDRESTSAGLFPSCSALARTNEVKSISGTTTLGNGLVKIICNSSGEGFNFQQSSSRTCGNKFDAGTSLQWHLESNRMFVGDETQAYKWSAPAPNRL